MTDSSAGSAYYSQGAYPMTEKARWGSHGSIAGSVHQSMASLYTPSTATSYILPIAQVVPDINKHTDDHMGMACCSAFINPIIGLFAVLLADRSRGYYNRCSYVKARKYGQYAQWTAFGAIMVMVLTLVLIVAAVGHHYNRFSQW